MGREDTALKKVQAEENTKERHRTTELARNGGQGTGRARNGDTQISKQGTDKEGKERGHPNFETRTRNGDIQISSRNGDIQISE
jgi:hypothetical protein